MAVKVVKNESYSGIPDIESLKDGDVIFCNFEESVFVERDLIFAKLNFSKKKSGGQFAFSICFSKKDEELHKLVSSIIELGGKTTRSCLIKKMRCKSTDLDSLEQQAASMGVITVLPGRPRIYSLPSGIDGGMDDK